MWTMLFTVPALVVSVLIYAITYWQLRCERCNIVVLARSAPSSRPYVKKIGILRGWGAVILDVLINDEFTCMYCGQRYTARQLTDTPSRRG